MKTKTKNIILLHVIGKPNCDISFYSCPEAVGNTSATEVFPSGRADILVSTLGRRARQSPALCT